MEAKLEKLAQAQSSLSQTQYVFMENQVKLEAKHDGISSDIQTSKQLLTKQPQDTPLCFFFGTLNLLILYILALWF